MDNRLNWIGLTIFSSFLVFLLAVLYGYGLEGIWQSGSLVVTIHVIFGLCYIAHFITIVLARLRQLKETGAVTEPGRILWKHADAAATRITLSMSNLLCLFFFVYYMMIEQKSIPVFLLWMILLITASTHPFVRAALSLITVRRRRYQDAHS
jgi:hypothetical protein